MLGLLCLMIFTVGALGDADLDSAVDAAIGQVADVIEGGGMDRFPIDDVIYRWSYHRLPGRLFCQRGWAMSLASLKRAGEIRVTGTPEDSILVIPLQLGSFVYGYERCVYSVLSIFKWNGRVKATVGRNLLEAEVSVNKVGDACTTTLNSIGLTEASDIKVTAGKGIAHHMEEKVAKPIADQVYKDIGDKINEKLIAVAPLAFANSDICKAIH